MRIYFRKNIANSITILNLLLGFVSIIFIALSFVDLDSQVGLKTACLLIFLAAIIDVFDGKIARKLGTSGDFGKEFDSLADLISFCLAPSLLIFSYYYELVNLDIKYLIINSNYLFLSSHFLMEFHMNI